MVKIATLSNCSKCDSIKKSLKSSGIRYNDYDCDEFPDYCDHLEDISKVVNYPMVVIESENDVLELYYVADDHYQLHLYGSIVRGYTLRPKLNLNTLIQSLKK